MRLIKTDFDMISIYKKVLDGKLYRFPPETWNPHKDGYENFFRCVRYLISDILQWERHNLLDEGSMSLFRKYKLGGAIGGLYHTTGIYKALYEAIPEWELKQWEFRHSSTREWSEEEKRGAIIWLFEEKLKWSYDMMLENVNVKTFSDNHLYGLLGHHFQTSPYKALKYAYPDRNWKLLKDRFVKQKSERFANLKQEEHQHPTSKISSQDGYDKVVAMLEEGKLNYTEIGKLLNVNYKVIMRIAKRRGIESSAKGRWGNTK
jgi:hypothetical protein